MNAKSPKAPDWRAPASPGPLNATVVLPGSKSQTSRALVIGSIAKKPTVVTGALASRDSHLAINAMETLGAKFDFAEDKNEMTIIPPDELRGGQTIDCGLAGTVMRFGPALAAFANGRTKFVGDPQAEKRPLEPLMKALDALGAQVTYQGTEGYLPLTVRGTATRADSVFSELGNDDREAKAKKTVGVDTTGSSQYLSALFLASPLIPKPTIIRAEGYLPSWPYVAMSLDMLKQQGVDIRRTSSSSWVTDPTRPAGNPISIEPDLSNAGPFLAAVLLSGGTLTIRDWPAETDQVGKYWLELLPRFGATVALSAAGLTVNAPAGLEWDGLELDMGAFGELAPTVAALCAFARTPSTLLGIGHLRGHETDRLEAMETEINRLGGSARVLHDGIRITPRPLQAGRIRTYEDHRMATFGAIIGLRVPGCTVEDIGTTAKTLPLFPARWQAMLDGDTSPEPLWPSEVQKNSALVLDPNSGIADAEGSSLG